jgi:hypothetical protein
MRFSSAIFFGSAACMLTLVIDRNARADDALQVSASDKPTSDDHGSPGKMPAFTIGSKPSWFLMAGVTTGGTVAAHDRGGFVGGEASVVRLSNAGRFFGFYGDGYYDFGIDRTYTTTGLELGYKFFGADGGVAARVGSGRIEAGATGRLFLTIGIVSIYGRYAIFPDPIVAGNEQVVQIGALVKVPFKIWGGANP